MIESALLSLIVPLYNHLPQTQAMLASLQATMPKGLAYEVVVVDDASTDGTREWLAQLTMPHTVVVLNTSNIGYAKAVNAGIARARGGLVALLNNDLLLSPGWLEPMLEALHDPVLNAGLVGNVQTRIADGALDHAGIHMTNQGKLEHVQSLPPAGTGRARVFAVTGACCLASRSVMDSMGGLSEVFLNGAEDVDLCQKIKAKGLHIVMAYRSVVGHHVSLSRDRSSPQNEINSRHLFSLWRTEFKRELARVWRCQMALNDPALRLRGMDGQWRAAVLPTPHALAQVMAESVLQQEECYWARTLDGADIHAGVATRCTVQGLQWSPAHGGYVLDHAAQLHVTGIRSLRNFYICGRTLHADGAKSVALTMIANGIQEKTITLAQGTDMNASMVNPVGLPGVSNCFSVSATSPVLVSHFVLDDHVVPPTGC